MSFRKKVQIHRIKRAFRKKVQKIKSAFSDDEENELTIIFTHKCIFAQKLGGNVIFADPFLMKKLTSAKAVVYVKTKH